MHYDSGIIPKQILALEEMPLDTFTSFTLSSKSSEEGAESGKNGTLKKSLKENEIRLEYRNIRISKVTNSVQKEKSEYSE